MAMIRTLEFNLLQAGSPLHAHESARIKEKANSVQKADVAAAYAGILKPLREWRSLFGNSDGTKLRITDRAGQKHEIDIADLSDHDPETTLISIAFRLQEQRPDMAPHPRDRILDQ